MASLTGATGFLGWHVGETLAARGWRVRAIVRPGSVKPLPAGLERREAPLDPDALAAALAGSDVVVHAAALTRAATERAMVDVNVGGTRAVVAACNAIGARLVFISSQAAIGEGTLARPSREDDEPRPLTAYGRSKLAAETLVREQARTPWTILRPSAVYGPGDRQFLPLFRLAARGRFLLTSRDGAAFTLVYAGDAARAVALAAEQGEPARAALFVGAEAHTADTVLQTIARVVDRPYRPIRVPSSVIRALGLAGDLAWRFGRQPLVDRARATELSADGFVCAVDRAHQVIGFRAETPLDEGFRRTLQWYRTRGWI